MGSLGIFLAEGQQVSVYLVVGAAALPAAITLSPTTQQHPYLGWMMLWD
jgi:hypothetical protein